VKAPARVRRAIGLGRSSHRRGRVLCSVRRRQAHDWIGDDAIARSSSAGASSARSLSPRRKRPSRRRPTIAIDGERRATRPRRGDRNATKGRAGLPTARRLLGARTSARPRSAPDGGTHVGRVADCRLVRTTPRRAFRCPSQRVVGKRRRQDQHRRPTQKDPRPPRPKCGKPTANYT
jgi:hypothetical protein